MTAILPVLPKTPIAIQFLGDLSRLQKRLFVGPQEVDVIIRERIVRHAIVP